MVRGGTMPRYNEFHALQLRVLEYPMVILLTLIHVIVCVFLVIVVLLQSGKAADLAGAFGGMGSQTTFGPRGSATVLSKATTIAAALFMITSMTLAILATRSAGGSSSVLDQSKGAAKTSAPAKTGQPAAQPAPPPGANATPAKPVTVPPVEPQPTPPQQPQNQKK
jgi:preprotein translocase subunit SecG